MSKTRMYLLMLAVFCLTIPVQAANIIWVSDNLKYDFDTNEPAEIGFIQLLRDQGHNVDFKGEYMPHEAGNDSNALNPDWLYWRELDPNKIAELNAADLIIIGRGAYSGCYDDGNEPLEWNAITTPILSQSAHLARSNKWGWINSTSMEKNYYDNVVTTVLDVNHVIFSGVELDEDDSVSLFLDPNCNVTLLNDTEVGAGNGSLLALAASDVDDSLRTCIAEWDTGDEYFEGSDYTAGGPRMYLPLCDGGKSIGILEGRCNLNAAGEQVFLNAVNYMIARGTHIIWVSDNDQYDHDANEASDIGYAEVLRAQGYNVDYKGEEWVQSPDDNDVSLNPEWQYWRTLDANKIDELEAADLIIVGRLASSSLYDDNDVANGGYDEKVVWNGLTTPILSQSAHLARANKWGWINSTSIQKYYSNDVVTTVLELDHAIFSGVELNEDATVTLVDPNGNVALIDDMDVGVGNGTLLAQAASDAEGMRVCAAEWKTGDEYFDGSGYYAGAPRMYLPLVDGGKGDGDFLQGSYNLTAAGEQVFLNAVYYLIFTASAD